MTVECLTHDSGSAHVLHTIILVLNGFYWAVIPKYMLFLPDLTLLQWQFWLVWMDLPSAVCAGMLSLSFLNRSQRTGYATIWARSCPGVKEKNPQKLKSNLSENLPDQTEVWSFGPRWRIRAVKCWACAPRVCPNRDSPHLKPFSTLYSLYTYLSF